MDAESDPDAKRSNIRDRVNRGASQLHPFGLGSDIGGPYRVGGAERIADKPGIQRERASDLLRVAG